MPELFETVDVPVRSDDQCQRSYGLANPTCNLARGHGGDECAEVSLSGLVLSTWPTPGECEFCGDTWCDCHGGVVVELATGGDR
ncbi:hypothetical protein C8K38_111218 [Rhodococcus sp. OK611]|uniref:hypothetical protein n=1 Tax=unclassified Rhodococcus (in: high G+C Gram-positive bacteria) TaxID=192944 RepID=UPI000BD7A6F8|nr:MULTISPECIES: hypothetical protein [unclassified Rhodococcus (in: high G+C Gram-positive bacteria)]PTR42049.1 hypothetical protein C8K38_111218 [Rhodococcus sp. OK611]SNX91504.1 hypothetical protein SAMN05447004_11039 [Rhodococcus sp. OK270]